MEKNKKILIAVAVVAILFIGIYILQGFVFGLVTDQNTETETINENSESEETEEQSSEVVGTIDEYFVFETNMLYGYTSERGEEYDYSIFNLYSDETKVQRVISANFSQVPVEEVLEYKDGTLFYVNGTQRGTMFNNLLDEENIYELVVMKEPLQIGTTWQSSEDSASIVTDVESLIETPVGSFSCIEITTNYSDGTFEKTYYAKDVGLVKTISTSSDGTEMIHSLSVFEENVESITINLPAFYYNAETEQNELIYMPMEISPEMDMVKNIENALKEGEEGELYSVLYGATINYIEIDDNSSTVHIDVDNYDFNNAGVTAEEEMIYGLVESLAAFFAKENVQITVNGGTDYLGHMGIIEQPLQPRTQN